MRWRQFIVLSAAALIAMTLGRAVLSAEIYEGAKLEAKANSIWFQDEDKLARWQELKAAGNAEALAAFEEEELSEREAWQFEPALSVKVLDYEQAEHRVNVEMLTPGRMQGTTWFVDEGGGAVGVHSVMGNREQVCELCKTSASVYPQCGRRDVP